MENLLFATPTVRKEVISFGAMIPLPLKSKIFGPSNYKIKDLKSQSKNSIKPQILTTKDKESVNKLPDEKPV